MSDMLMFRELTRPIENRNTLLKESGAVAAGGILALKGPSGAGKSTLLRLLARLIAPRSGDVYLEGVQWREIPVGVWRRRVHYVSQKPVMFVGTVEDNLRLPFTLESTGGKIPFSGSAAEELMDELELPRSLLTQNAQTLSGGEGARIALIRALLVSPAVMLLDEPTAYLDERSRMAVVGLMARWVREQPKRAMIVVSHNDTDLAGLDDFSVLEIGSGEVARHA